MRRPRAAVQSAGPPCTTPIPFPIPTPAPPTPGPQRHSETARQELPLFPTLQTRSACQNDIDNVVVTVEAASSAPRLILLGYGR